MLIWHVSFFQQTMSRLCLTFPLNLKFYRRCSLCNEIFCIFFCGFKLFRTECFYSSAFFSRKLVIASLNEVLHRTFFLLQLFELFLKLCSKCFDALSNRGGRSSSNSSCLFSRLSASNETYKMSQFTF